MKLLPQVPKIFAYLTVEFFILKVINSKQDLENEKHLIKLFLVYESCWENTVAKLFQELKLSSSSTFLLILGKNTGPKL